MLNTHQQATTKVSVGPMVRNDSPPSDTNTTNTKDTQGRRLQYQDLPSRMLSSQSAEPSNQTVVIDSRKRSALVVPPRPESSVAPEQLPSQDNSDPEKSQVHKKYVQNYSKHCKAIISVPNPELDPEGYELGMNAYVRSDEELAKMFPAKEASDRKHPYEIYRLRSEIRSSFVSQYTSHLRQKNYNAGWSI